MKILILTVLLSLVASGTGGCGRKPGMHEAIIKLNWPSDNPSEGRYYWRNWLNRNHRNYLVLRLTGNPDTDDILLGYAHIRIGEILQNLDTVNGVKFVWNDSLTYGEFIRALDVPRTEDVQVYFAFEDSLWMLNTKTPADTMAANKIKTLDL